MSVRSQRGHDDRPLGRRARAGGRGHDATTPRPPPGRRRACSGGQRRARRSGAHPGWSGWPRCCSPWWAASGRWPCRTTGHPMRRHTSTSFCTLPTATRTPGTTAAASARRSDSTRTGTWSTWRSPGRASRRATRRSARIGPTSTTSAGSSPTPTPDASAPTARPGRGTRTCTTRCHSTRRCTTRRWRGCSGSSAGCCPETARPRSTVRWGCSAWRTCCSSRRSRCWRGLSCAASGATTGRVRWRPSSPCASRSSPTSAERSTTTTCSPWSARRWRCCSQAWRGAAAPAGPTSASAWSWDWRS